MKYTPQYEKGIKQNQKKPMETTQDFVYKIDRITVKGKPKILISNEYFVN